MVDPEEGPRVSPLFVEKKIKAGQNRLTDSTIHEQNNYGVIHLLQTTTKAERRLALCTTSYSTQKASLIFFADLLYSQNIVQNNTKI